MPDPTAHSVDARISAHEALCAERWGQIRSQLSDVKDAIGSMRLLTITAAGGLIAGMGGLIVTLVLHK